MDRIRHPLVLVAAVARNRVIGAGGQMPWRLPGELAHFRSVTIGHPLLMGRKTFESIGRPLPGRLTTILSGSEGFAPKDAMVARDLASGLRSANRQADALEATAIMVVGGGAVYRSTIGLAQRLLLTEVDAEPEGDTLFPAIDPDIWVKADERTAPRGPDDCYSYRFVAWRRRQTS